MSVPNDVLEDGDATRILLMRKAFLTKTSADRLNAVPTQVSDDTYGVRVCVMRSRASADPNTHAIPPDRTLFVRLASHDAYTEIAAKTRVPTA